ncbi:universal stress protein [Haloprofundus sp. MHR1]|uniref:universal stress protein n=1 Tax=Haloprofundus sp. MHR1 TaxID=2572921 RepID=UPI0010BEDB2D|nr:universal stress protein [Haloprofundus sp. MHR1]QCJ45850.1 universal stress protein [Haloprofundus sp. MHR1]
MAAHSAFAEDTTAVGDQRAEHRFEPAPAAVSGGDGVFEHVLLAVDPEMDERVAEVALSVAASHGARVDALSVVRMNASVDHWDVVVERREERAEEALDAVGDAAADHDLSVEKRLRYGTPAEEIAKYAEHHDVDLVVVGEPSRSGLRRFLSPKSVTDRVRRSTAAPVLTV